MGQFQPVYFRRYLGIHTVVVPLNYLNACNPIYKAVHFFCEIDFLATYSIFGTHVIRVILMWHVAS